jgi:hypothetical protein
MAGALAIPRPERRPRRRLLLALTAGLALAAAAALAFTLLGPGSHHERASKTLATARFAISYPGRGWESLPQAELAKLPGKPAAVLRAADRSAAVIVREQPPVRGDLAKLGRALTPELKKRFEGFRPLSARIVRLAKGPALSYTFVRGQTGSVQSELIVPAGARSYAVDVVTHRATPRTAAQAGASARSFVPAG